MGMSGNFLSYIKGLNDPFEAQDGRWDFSRDAAAEKALRGECPDFSRVAAGNFGFLSSYTRDLRDHLVGPQESTVSMQVERGLSGFLSSQCWVLGPHLALRPQPQASSPLLTWISGFLWSLHRGVRRHLMWRCPNLLSFRAITVELGFLPN